MDNPLVQPDPGLFIWTILTFLVLLWLLAKFAWRPLLQALETPSERDPQVAGRRAAGKEELERLHAESAPDHPEGARRGRGDHHAEPVRRRAAARGDARRRRGPRPTTSSSNAERQIQLETSPRAASRSAARRSTSR